MLLCCSNHVVLKLSRIPRRPRKKQTLLLSPFSFTVIRLVGYQILCVQFLHYRRHHKYVSVQVNFKSKATVHIIFMPNLVRSIGVSDQVTISYRKIHPFFCCQKPQNDPRHSFCTRSSIFCCICCLGQRMQWFNERSFKAINQTSIRATQKPGRIRSIEILVGKMGIHRTGMFTCIYHKDYSQM